MPSKKDQQIFWSFYPSEPFKNGHFNVRHTVYLVERIILPISIFGIFTKFNCNFFVFTYVMFSIRGRFLLLHPFLLFLLSNFWQVFVKVTEIQSLFSKDQIYFQFFCPDMLWISLKFTCQIILTFQDTCLPLFHPIPSPHFQKHLPPIR